MKLRVCSALVNFYIALDELWEAENLPGLTSKFRVEAVAPEKPCSLHRGIDSLTRCALFIASLDRDTSVSAEITRAAMSICLSS